MSGCSRHTATKAHPAWCLPPACPRLPLPPSLRPICSSSTRAPARRDTAKRWLPASAPRRIADLEASQGRWVRAALSKAARSATLEAALLATARQSLPRTYLQLVGSCPAGLGALTHNAGCTG